MKSSHKALPDDSTPVNSNDTRSELTIDPVATDTSIEQDCAAIDVVEQLPEPLKNPSISTFEHDSHLG